MSDPFSLGAFIALVSSDIYLAVHNTLLMAQFI
jgi:hypothetical protein